MIQESSGANQTGQGAQATYGKKPLQYLVWTGARDCVKSAKEPILSTYYNKADWSLEASPGQHGLL